jgi:uncharacterized protein
VLDVAPTAARLVSEFVPGPAGPLETLLRMPPHAAGAAGFAHPHPLHGGTMHTKVVHRAARLLSDRFSLAALRFNFRGVGASGGRHDEGRGEVDDVLAAAAWVRARVPAGPFVLGGFSFGSVAAIGAASRVNPDVLFLAGVPLTRWSVPHEAPYRGSVVWLQGDRDEFADAARSRELAERWGWDFAAVPGADHFFTGALDAFEAAASQALSRVLEATPR